MVRGWQTIDGKRYYFNDDGVMQTAGRQSMERNTSSCRKVYDDRLDFFWSDEILSDAGWTYADRMVQLWKYKYYLASDGKMVRGWQTISGKKYYFNTDGIMQTGWQTIDGKKYFFMPEGYMMTGWISFGKTRYYLG